MFLAISALSTPTMFITMATNSLGFGNSPLAISEDMILGLLQELSGLDSDQYPAARRLYSLLEDHPVSRASKEASLTPQGNSMLYIEI